MWQWSKQEIYWVDTKKICHFDNLFVVNNEHRLWPLFWTDSSVHPSRSTSAWIEYLSLVNTNSNVVFFLVLNLTERRRKTFQMFGGESPGYRRGAREDMEEHLVSPTDRWLEISYCCIPKSNICHYPARQTASPTPLLNAMGTAHPSWAPLTR